VNAMSEPVARPAFVPGLFSTMPAEQYHAIEAMSSGGIKKMLQSPLHYKLMRDTPNEPTPAMQFGTAVHAGALEPYTFSERVVAAPEVNKRTKDGKAEWDAFAAANAGKVVLSADDYARALRCIEAVGNHPGAMRLLHGSRREVSLFWIDDTYKVPCKVRLDVWNFGGIVDLKTTQDAAPRRSAARSRRSCTTCRGRTTRRVPSRCLANGPSSSPLSPSSRNRRMPSRATRCRRMPCSSAPSCAPKRSRATRKR